MEILRIIYSQLCDKIGRLNRIIFRNKIERKKLNNKDFTIFSQNCIGSVMYHDLGLQFNSPTINMLFKPKDFIKFLDNLNFYLSKKITFINSDKKYPIGKLYDIEIEFIHYHNQEEVLKAWDRRKKRINLNDLFVICCDDGLTYDDILYFDNLPYKNKIIFLSKQYKNIKSGIYCKDFPDKTDARLLNFSNLLGKRYYQKYIDYVNFFNNKEFRRK